MSSLYTNPKKLDEFFKKYKDGYHNYNGKTTGCGGNPTETYTIGRGDGQRFKDICYKIRKKERHIKPLFLFEGSVDIDSFRVDIPSNSTIVGLPGSSLKGGMRVEDENNVIFFNVNFVETKKTEDNIGVRRAERLLILHCSFYKTRDEFIGFKNDSSYMTCAYCYFGEKQNKLALFNGDEDEKNKKGSMRITIHHCVLKCSSRNPKTKQGLTHIYNCYYYDNNHYSMCSTMYGITVSERNVFEKTDKTMILAVPSEKTREPDGEIYSYQDKIINPRKSDYIDKSIKIQNRMAIEYVSSLNPVSDVKKICLDRAGLHSGSSGSSGGHSIGVRFILIEWQRDILDFFDTILYEKFPPYKKLYDKIGREGIFTIIALIFFVISYSVWHRRYMRQKAVNTYKYMNILRRRRRRKELSSKNSNSENQVVIEVHNPVVPSAASSNQVVPSAASSTSSTTSAAASNPVVPSAAASTPSTTPSASTQTTTSSATASAPSTTPSASTPSTTPSATSSTPST